MNFTKIDLKDLAFVVCQALKKAGIDVVLVGGACISIYSQNKYQSMDLDFATYEELRPIQKALEPLGFQMKGRCFVHENCPYLLDFVNPPISVGGESVKRFRTLKTSLGSLKLLTPTDSVKDRLSAFFHWNDQQALEQAWLVARDHRIWVNDLKRWAAKEGHLRKFSVFLNGLK